MIKLNWQFFYFLKSRLFKRTSSYSFPLSDYLLQYNSKFHFLTLLMVFYNLWITHAAFLKRYWSHFWPILSSHLLILFWPGLLRVRGRGIGAEIPSAMITVSSATGCSTNIRQEQKLQWQKKFKMSQSRGLKRMFWHCTQPLNYHNVRKLHCKMKVN